MNQSVESPLVCPVCRAALQKGDRNFYCPQGHNFDIARQGYVNLLLSHQRHSKHPGDSKEMIKARRTFLAEGHYLPIYTALEELTLKHISKTKHNSSIQLTDLGCGEGYYTHQLDKALREILLKKKTSLQTWGLDISKDAIINACKYNSSVRWLIANLGQTPFSDHSMDILTTLFCPINPNEIARLLKPGGLLIFVKPDTKHLIQLREHLYSDIKTRKINEQNGNSGENKNENTADNPVHHPDLKLIDSLALFHPMQLNTSASIQALFEMTPHYWRTKAQAREKIYQLTQLNTDIAVKLYCYQRKL